MRLFAALAATALCAGCLVVVPPTAGTSPPATLTGAAATAMPDPAATGDFTSQVNAFRAQAGLGPLSPDPELTVAAQAHVADMVAKGYRAHTGSDGSSPGQRARRAGCGWGRVAENWVETGRGTAAALDWWAHSPGHRANILDGRFRAYGLGQVGPTYVLLLADGC